MAYDPVKAHEYYEKYKKKGLKKGRKKGKKKAAKGKQTNLVGLSNSGLNDTGKMQWAMAKEKLKTEMNAALAKAKTPEEKDKIRAEYQNKALEQLKQMKSNSSLAQAKKQKAAKSSSKGSSSKGSSSKSSSSGSRASGSGSAKTSSSSAVKTTTQTAQTTTPTAATTAATSAAVTQTLQKIQDTISQIQEKLENLPPEKKEEIKQTIQVQIDAIKERLKNKTLGISLR